MHQLDHLWLQRILNFIEIAEGTFRQYFMVIRDIENIRLARPLSDNDEILQKLDEIQPKWFYFPQLVDTTVLPVNILILKCNNAISSVRSEVTGYPQL